MLETRIKLRRLVVLQHVRPARPLIPLIITMVLIWVIHFTVVILLHISRPEWLASFILLIFCIPWFVLLWSVLIENFECSLFSFTLLRFMSFIVTLLFRLWRLLHCLLRLIRGGLWLSILLLLTVLEFLLRQLNILQSFLFNLVLL